MQDGRIPKNVLYGELCHWNQTCRGPPRRFIEVCKRDLKAGNINPAAWEAVAVDRSHRRLAFKECTLACEEWNEAQTAVGSISTHRAIHGIHLQQLQQSLPIQNRIVPQPQKALQLNHWLNLGADYIVSRDRRDDNIIIFIIIIIIIIIILLLLLLSSIYIFNFLTLTLTCWYISTPFAAGQASSYRWTNHGISRITEVPDILSCPVILALAYSNCIVWFSWITAVA